MKALIISFSAVVLSIGMVSMTNAAPPDWASEQGKTQSAEHGGNNPGQGHDSGNQGESKGKGHLDGHIGNTRGVGHHEVPDPE